MAGGNRHLKQSGAFGRLISLGPMGLWTLSFFLFPFIYICVLSFCTRNQYGQVVYKFTIENFKTLLKPTYMLVILETIKFSAIVTVITIFIAYPYAYLAARASKRVQKSLMLFIMIPFWTSSLLRVYAIMNMVSANGLINTVLLDLGIIQAPLQILYTRFAVYFGMIYTLLPLMIMPLYANLQKINPSVLEAARDLGASSFQLFARVILPNSVPGILAGVILVFIPAMFNFYVSDALGGGKGIIVGNVIQNQFLVSKNWPLGAALAMVVMSISAVLIAVNNRVIGKKAEGV